MFFKRLLIIINCTVEEGIFFFTVKGTEKSRVRVLVKIPHFNKGKGKQYSETFLFNSFPPCTMNVHLLQLSG